MNIILFLKIESLLDQKCHSVEVVTLVENRWPFCAQIYQGMHFQGSKRVEKGAKISFEPTHKRTHTDTQAQTRTSHTSHVHTNKHLHRLFYSCNYGSVHLVMLNSYMAFNPGSPQVRYHVVALCVDAGVHACVRVCLSVRLYCVCIYICATLAANTSMVSIQNELCLCEESNSF